MIGSLILIRIAGALRVTESIRGIEIDNSYDPRLHFDFRVSLNGNRCGHNAN